MKKMKQWRVEQVYGRTFTLLAPAQDITEMMVILEQLEDFNTELVEGVVKVGEGYIVTDEDIDVELRESDSNSPEDIPF